MDGWKNCVDQEVRIIGNTWTASPEIGNPQELLAFGLPYGHRSAAKIPEVPDMPAAGNSLEGVA